MNEHEPVTRKVVANETELNRDPITGTPGAHPLGTGAGESAGGRASAGAQRVGTRRSSDRVAIELGLVSNHFPGHGFIQLFIHFNSPSPIAGISSVIVSRARLLKPQQACMT